jgi:hypothetical protein
LAEAGIPVSWSSHINDIIGHARGDHGSLLKSAGFFVAEVDQIIKRTLTESGWSDSSELGAGRLIVSGRVDHRVPETTTRDALKVTTRPSFPVGQAESAALSVQLRFSGTAANCASVVHLRGENLDEHEAAATVILNSEATWLSLCVPMASCIEQSVSAVDIAWRLLNHPGAQDLVGDRRPEYAHSSLVRSVRRSPTRRSSRAVMDLAPVLDVTDALRLDNQIDLVDSISDGLARLIAENRLTSAALSTIGSKYLAESG